MPQRDGLDEPRRNAQRSTSSASSPSQASGLGSIRAEGEHLGPVRIVGGKLARWHCSE